METKINEKKSSILNKIYITRRSRIIASERVLKLDSFISTMNIYYSAILLVFSICSISNENNNLNNVLISSSILVFAFNTFAYSQNFKEKYLAYKENYIELDELYIKIENDENEIVEEDYFKQYFSLLKSCPNHSTWDYYKYLIDEKNFCGNINCLNVIFYFVCKVFKFFCYITAVLAPFLMIYFIELIMKIFNSFLN